MRVFILFSGRIYHIKHGLYQPVSGGRVDVLLCIVVCEISKVVFS
jgi:hypothetical protein